MVGTLYSGTYQHGFLLVSGTYTAIDAPFAGAAGTAANAINNRGVIVGAWYPASNDTSHGFTLHNGVYAQVPDYPGSTAEWPWNINTHCDIVGYIDDASNATHGFLLHNGTYTLLDPPGSVYTIAIGINDSGQIVGAYCLTLAACSEPFNGIHGFLYSNGTYTTIDLPGPTQNYTDLAGINNQGVMVGAYTDANGLIHSFLTSQ
jgi:uncharacterized membrane protein